MFKPLGVVSDTKYAGIIDTFWKLRYMIGADSTRNVSHQVARPFVRISSPAKVARTRIRNVP